MPQIYILVSLLGIISAAEAKQWTWTMPQVSSSEKASSALSAPENTSDIVADTFSASTEELSENIPADIPIPTDATLQLSKEQIFPDTESFNTNMGKDDFQQIDTDRNGSLDEAELLNFQQRKLDNITEQTFKTLDINHDEKIASDEISIYYNRLNRDKKYDTDIQNRFIKADIDENGYLDQSELKHFLQKDLLNNNQQIFTLMDTDGDKKVTTDEYNQIMEFFGNLF